jgi:hypothetical protein
MSKFIPFKPEEEGKYDAIFSDEEYWAITKQFAKGRGEEGFTQDDLQGVFDNLARVRYSAMLLNHLIDGDLICDWDGKEVYYNLDEQLRKKWDDVVS